MTEQSQMPLVGPPKRRGWREIAWFRPLTSSTHTALVVTRRGRLVSILPAGGPRVLSDYLAWPYDFREVDTRERLLVLEQRVESFDSSYEFSISLRLSYQVVRPDRVALDLEDVSTELAHAIVQSLRLSGRSFGVEQDKTFEEHLQDTLITSDGLVQRVQLLGLGLRRVDVTVTLDEPARAQAESLRFAMRERPLHFQIAVDSLKPDHRFDVIVGGAYRLTDRRAHTGPSDITDAAIQLAIAHTLRRVGITFAPGDYLDAAKAMADLLRKDSLLQSELSMVQAQLLRPTVQIQPDHSMVHIPRPSVVTVPEMRPDPMLRRARQSLPRMGRTPALTDTQEHTPQQTPAPDGRRALPPPPAIAARRVGPPVQPPADVPASPTLPLGELPTPGQPLEGAYTLWPLPESQPSIPARPALAQPDDAQDTRAPWADLIRGAEDHTDAPWAATPPVSESGSAEPQVWERSALDFATQPLPEQPTPRWLATPPATEPAPAEPQLWDHAALDAATQPLSEQLAAHSAPISPAMENDPVESQPAQPQPWDTLTLDALEPPLLEAQATPWAAMSPAMEPEPAEPQPWDALTLDAIELQPAVTLDAVEPQPVDAEETPWAALPASIEPEPVEPQPWDAVALEAAEPQPVDAEDTPWAALSASIEPEPVDPQPVDAEETPWAALSATIEPEPVEPQPWDAVALEAVEPQPVDAEDTPWAALSASIEPEPVEPQPVDAEDTPWAALSATIEPEPVEPQLVDAEDTPWAALSATIEPEPVEPQPWDAVALEAVEPQPVDAEETPWAALSASIESEPVEPQPWDDVALEAVEPQPVDAEDTPWAALSASIEPEPVEPQPWDGVALEAVEPQLVDAEETPWAALSASIESAPVEPQPLDAEDTPWATLSASVESEPVEPQPWDAVVLDAVEPQPVDAEDTPWAALSASIEPEPVEPQPWDGVALEPVEPQPWDGVALEAVEPQPIDERDTPWAALSASIEPEPVEPQPWDGVALEAAEPQPVDAEDTPWAALSASIESEPVEPQPWDGVALEAAEPQPVDAEDTPWAALSASIEPEPVEPQPWEQPAAAAQSSLGAALASEEPWSILDTIAGSEFIADVPSLSKGTPVEDLSVSLDWSEPEVVAPVPLADDLGFSLDWSEPEVVAPVAERPTASSAPVPLADDLGFSLDWSEPLPDVYASTWVPSADITDNPIITAHSDATTVAVPEPAIFDDQRAIANGVTAEHDLAQSVREQAYVDALPVVAEQGLEPENAPAVAEQELSPWYASPLSFDEQVPFGSAADNRGYMAFETQETAWDEPLAVPGAPDDDHGADAAIAPLPETFETRETAWDEPLAASYDHQVADAFSQLPDEPFDEEPNATSEPTRDLVSDDANELAEAYEEPAPEVPTEQIARIIGMIQSYGPAWFKMWSLELKERPERLPVVLGEVTADPILLAQAADPHVQSALLAALAAYTAPVTFPGRRAAPAPLPSPAIAGQGRDEEDEVPDWLSLRVKWNGHGGGA